MVSIRSVLTGLSAAAALCHLALAQDRQAVELELVLAIDTSTSVDASEYELQRRGLAHAFRDPDIIKAIEAIGANGIAVTLIQWSTSGKHLTSVDWTLIRNAQSAARFADKIDAAPRLLTGFTGIASAIRFSLRQIEDNGFAGTRKVIDVSGDGASSRGDPRIERDRAIARGVTVNGLAILTNDPDFMEYGLKEHYAHYVVGGPGSFLITAAGFEDFARAIRKKLIREITAPGLASIDRRLARSHP